MDLFLFDVAIHLHPIDRVLKDLQQDSILTEAVKAQYKCSLEAAYTVVDPPPDEEAHEPQGSTQNRPTRPQVDLPTASTINLVLTSVAIGAAAVCTIRYRAELSTVSHRAMKRAGRTLEQISEYLFGST